MMYLMTDTLWPSEYTTGHVYEGKDTKKPGIIRVVNNLGKEEDMSASWFRKATLEDAYNPTHYLDGSMGAKGEGLSPGLEKAAAPKPSELQIGGDHYKKAAIQPAVFAELNGLTHLEANVVKRVYRHSRGGKGREDIEKAIHELQLLLELRY